MCEMSVDNKRMNQNNLPLLHLLYIYLNQTHGLDYMNNNGDMGINWNYQTEYNISRSELYKKITYWYLLNND